MITNSNEIEIIINSEYVFLSLYCDDKHKVDSSDYIITKNKDTLTTLGAINSNFQKKHFLKFCQPYYAIINSDLNNLVKPFEYNPNK